MWAGPGSSLGPEELPATLSSEQPPNRLEPWALQPTNRPTESLGLTGAPGVGGGGGGGTPTSSAALLPLTATGFTGGGRAPLESSPSRIWAEPFSWGNIDQRACTLTPPFLCPGPLPGAFDAHLCSSGLNQRGPRPSAGGLRAPGHHAFSWKHSSLSPPCENTRPHPTSKAVTPS